MRWIRTPGGKFDHAVFLGAARTACGRSIAGAKIVPPRFDRCYNCLREWEDRGRKEAPPVNRPPSRSEYQPRFTYADWENS